MCERIFAVNAQILLARAFLLNPEDESRDPMIQFPVQYQECHDRDRGEDIKLEHPSIMR